MSDDPSEFADDKTEEMAFQALPYPLADGTHISMWMWVFERVMQHPDTPLTDKTLDFCDAAYDRAVARIAGRAVKKLEAVK